MRNLELSFRSGLFLGRVRLWSRPMSGDTLVYYWRIPAQYAQDIGGRIKSRGGAKTQRFGSLSLRLRGLSEAGASLDFCFGDAGLGPERAHSLPQIPRLGFKSRHLGAHTR